jgi:hypothetical protein
MVPLASFIDMPRYPLSEGLIPSIVFRAFYFTAALISDLKIQVALGQQ